MNTQLTKTRTNTLNLQHKGYAGEYSDEAFEILDGQIDDQKIVDEKFPYGELGWFDIMVDENGNEYAVYGADNMLTDSVAYIMPLNMQQITKASNNGYEWVVNTNEVIDNVDTLVDFLRKYNRPFSFDNGTKELCASPADCTAMDALAAKEWSE